MKINVLCIDHGLDQSKLIEWPEGWPVPHKGEKVAAELGGEEQEHYTVERVTYDPENPAGPVVQVFAYYRGER